MTGLLGRLVGQGAGEPAAIRPVARLRYVAPLEMTGEDAPPQATSPVRGAEEPRAATKLPDPERGHAAAAEGGPIPAPLVDPRTFEPAPLHRKDAAPLRAATSPEGGSPPVDMPAEGTPSNRGARRRADAATERVSNSSVLDDVDGGLPADARVAARAERAGDPNDGTRGFPFEGEPRGDERRRAGMEPGDAGSARERVPALPERLLESTPRAGRGEASLPAADGPSAAVSRRGPGSHAPAEVHVTIGSIEVTAVHAAPAEPLKRDGGRERRGPMPLEEYLAKREGRTA